MLLETIIIIIIILTIKNICELYNYNTNADLIEIYKDTNANIVENYQNKNLIIVNNVISKIDKLNNLSFFFHSMIKNYNILFLLILSVFP